MKFPFSRFIVSGQSMFPTLQPNQQVVTLNWFYNPKINDLIVVNYKNKPLIKRIQKISDQKIFVVGDNSKESTDSRDFGWIKQDQIIGKVMIII